MEPTPVKNRWVIFAAAWIITFFIAAVAVFSVISPALVKANGWSASEVALAFSLYTLSLSVCGIFSGRIADRYGTVPLMYAGGALFGLGWFLTGSATTPGMLYLTFGVIAGAGCGIVYNPTVATALKWFTDIRGKASGLLLAAAAIGPAIMSPIIANLLEKTDPTTTLRTLGLVFFGAIAAVGWLIKSPNMSVAPHKNQEQENHSNDLSVNFQESSQKTWRQMISTPVFWALLAIFACAAAAGTMLVTSLSTISQFQVGAVGAMSAASFGALAVSISTISNFAGRVGFGIIFDKIGGYLSLVVSLALTILAMLLMSVANNLILFVVCVVILGCAFGAILVIFPPLTSTEFGTANLGINYGIMFLGYALGGFIGPRLTASLFSEEIGYRNAYYGAVALALVGIGIAFSLHLRSRTAQKKLPAIEEVSNLVSAE